MISLKEIFPLEGHITQEIINNADVSHHKSCIGALTLRDALNKVGYPSYSAIWCNKTGNVIEDNHCYDISTIDDTEMMSVKEPKKVMFIIL